LPKSLAAFRFWCLTSRISAISKFDPLSYHLTLVRSVSSASTTKKRAPEKLAEFSRKFSIDIHWCPRPSTQCIWNRSFVTTTQLVDRRPYVILVPSPARLLNQRPVRCRFLFLERSALVEHTSFRPTTLLMTHLLSSQSLSSSLERSSLPTRLLSPSRALPPSLCSVVSS
jgi:hypothetical protein